MTIFVRLLFLGSVVLMLRVIDAQQFKTKTDENSIVVSQKTTPGISTKQGFEPPNFTQANKAGMGWHYLVVTHSNEFAPEILARYETVAKRLSESAEKSQYLPQERLNHFSWITPEIAPPIIGWNGVIRDMRETPKGLLVTLTVTAKFPGNFQAGAYTNETFLLNDTAVQPVSLEKSPADLPKVITVP